MGLGSVVGDAAEIIEMADAGEMLDWEDIEGIKRFIIQQLENSDLVIGNLNQKRDIYSRKSLTNKLVDFMDRI